MNNDDGDDVILNTSKIVAIVIFATLCVIPCSYHLIIKPLCNTPNQTQNISEIEDTVITDWRAGDYVVWKNDTQHLAANVGKTARYTLQITGVIE